MGETKMSEFFDKEIKDRNGNISIVSFSYEYDGWDDKEILEIHEDSKEFPHIFSDYELEQMKEIGREYGQNRIT